MPNKELQHFELKVRQRFRPEGCAAMLESGFVAFAIIVALVIVLGGLFSRYGREWNEL
jgi:hypothetical protein